MNILIITMNIGDNAPGIVFERLISGISRIHNVEVFTIYNKMHDKSIKIQEVRYKTVSNHRISQLILLFGINPLDVLWSNKVNKIVKKRKIKYDLVLSLISNEHYAALIAGVRISRTIKTKLAVYSVDAIPAPLGWSKDNIYFRSCKKFIRKYLSKADILLSANHKMLRYQRSILKEKNYIADVVYNPSPQNIYVYNKPKTQIFLYTGQLYNLRRVNSLFKAFKKIHKDYPQMEIHFVGSRPLDDDYQILNESERDAIKVFPWKSDLDIHYENALCLFDIDADTENDVYLSSKMTTYIMINRPIISITGKNSPSRQLFKGIPSILQCYHNPNEISSCMKNVIERPITSFNDRDEVRKRFYSENIINNLNKIITQL